MLWLWASKHTNTHYVVRHVLSVSDPASEIFSADRSQCVADCWCHSLSTSFWFCVIVRRQLQLSNWNLQWVSSELFHPENLHSPLLQTPRPLTGTGCCGAQDRGPFTGSEQHSTALYLTLLLHTCGTYMCRTDTEEMFHQRQESDCIQDSSQSQPVRFRDQFQLSCGSSSLSATDLHFSVPHQRAEGTFRNLVRIKLGSVSLSKWNHDSTLKLYSLIF